MCCSNITHCPSVQKYWTKFSLQCKQRQFSEHFWCCTYLLSPMWPTTVCLNYITWLKGICLNPCKQRKYSSRNNGITSVHIAGAWVLREKKLPVWTQKERERAEQYARERRPFPAKDSPECQVTREAPGSFQLMFPFQTGPRREIICNFSKHVAKHAHPLSPPPPQAAALTLSACSLMGLMGYRLFPCSYTKLRDTKTGFCPQCCLFPALFWTTAFFFFSLKCGFLKADKSIIMENNVASQRGCKLVKPECKLFCNEYCWYAGNNPE